ncbi:MAG: DUF493 domain-containing protein [Gammaproteobacteria bacterium]|nr:DUF493 domain-containing protein [Gammaproteobacteria bacterium]MCD8525111.1 DUF493 domain-containing protein [Gammaproteobacteria bacterium]
MHKPHQHQETSRIDFPCLFTIKTFGKATQEYQTAVLRIMKQQLSESFDETSVRQRYSKDNNYLALSITITAQSKQQLDSIYHALSQEPLVTMAL